jgi:hypothetical protein
VGGHIASQYGRRSARATRHGRFDPARLGWRSPAAGTGAAACAVGPIGGRGPLVGLARLALPLAVRDVWARWSARLSGSGAGPSRRGRPTARVISEAGLGTQMEMKNSQAHVQEPRTISPHKAEMPEAPPVEPELPPEEEPEPETPEPPVREPEEEPVPT